MILVFLGKAGTGKGTQAQLLAKNLGMIQASMGDILREEIAKKTALGRQIEEIVKSGQLTPDSMTAQMLDVWLDEKEISKGIVFDGFPRTFEQTGMLEELLEKRKLKIDLVLNFVVLEELLIKRLSNRRTCRKCKKIYNLITMPPKKAGVCDIDNGELYQRDDDKEAAIRKRFASYDEQINPIIEFYKGKVIEVDASKSVAEVDRQVMKILEKQKA